VHNNGKDTLGKFDPRSDEVIFFGYFSHSKAYKVFNKRTLCAEESVHVLFDETNSLIVNDAQDKEFELGLARKDLLVIHEKGKSPENAPGTGAVLSEGGEGVNQIGGSEAEPGLKQYQPNSSQTGSEIGSRTGSKIGFKAGLETGSKTGPEPISSSSSARMESISMNPRP